MKTLVLNSGSSTVKFALFNGKKCLGRGVIDRIGIEGGDVFYATDGLKPVKRKTLIDTHHDAVSMALDLLLEHTPSLVDHAEIGLVGHRYPHAGEHMMQPAVVTKKVEKVLHDCQSFAPLHNPAALDGIKSAQKLLPKAKHVVTFDTGFFSDMKEPAFLYGIPYRLYRRHHVRRFGFHGASHAYVSETAAKHLKKPLKSLKIVSCHLGNGASIAAIEKGRGMESSLGFTPCDGVIMGTRSGSLDPLAVPYLSKKEGLTLHELENMLMYESGLLGISGVSSDMGDIDRARKKGNKRAQLAIDTWVHHCVRMIGEKVAVLNGADVLIFTAGIGEHFSYGREKICEHLSFLGLSLDRQKNRQKTDGIRVISKPSSKIKVLVVPTDEEQMIARMAADLS